MLQQLIDEGTENRLIPVDDWPAFADKGNLANLIQWMPIAQVAETLIQLYNARDRVKAVLYEITGIGDIMRGMTNPNETLGAQELKANFATRRIVPQQKEVARFARDLLRLMGAVIAEHVSPRTISLITGCPQLDPVPALPPRPLPPPLPAAPASAPQPPPALAAYQRDLANWQTMAGRVQAIVAANNQKQQQFDAAVTLLRQDGAHGFRIDIETNSTIAPDEQAEKQARVEFLAQMAPLLEQVVPAAAMGNPALAAVCREITLFAARGFRVARTLEEALEGAFEALARMPPSPKFAGADQGRAGRGDERLCRSRDPCARSRCQSRVEREKNAIATARIASEQHLGQMKLATQAAGERSKLALAAEKLEAEKALRSAEIGAIAAREAQGLA